MIVAYTYDPRRDTRSITVEISTAELANTGTPDELIKLLPPAIFSASGEYPVSQALYRLSVLAQAIEDANKQPKG